MAVNARLCDRGVPPSVLMRWCKFNLVGGIGIVVQFAALWFVKSVMHFNYLAATAIAVEAAVVHNFIWHRRFTWVDRTNLDRLALSPLVLHAAGAEVESSLNALIAALKRRATQNRLWRFNLSNGAVSILGNLVLMKLMVGLGHMHYLVANTIAIAVCSVVNFMVSEAWVFAEKGEERL